MKLPVAVVASAADPKELREELPIAYVMEQWGYLPAEQENDGSKLVYLNPWRNDTVPSLDVFLSDQGVQRAGDMAIGFQGSVLDLIGFERDTTSVREILDEGRKLYAQYLADKDSWAGPRVDNPTGDGVAPKVIPEAARDRLSTGVLSESNPAREKLHASHPYITSDTLRDFRVVGEGDSLAVPYPGDPTPAIRYRDPDGGKMYARGSKPGLYYKPGESLADAESIVLCEGETDVWTIYSIDPSLFPVGVPGVGHQPTKFADELTGKSVTIIFDGDTAGRDGALRWARVLQTSECSVRIAPMPDGFDVSDLDPEAILSHLSMSRAMVTNSSGMDDTSQGYGVNTGKPDDLRTVCNFTLVTKSVFDFGEDGPRSFLVEPVLSGAPFGQEFVLTFEDMQSSGSLHRWATQFSGSWWGGPTDHRRLRAVLEEQAIAVPAVAALNRPGLINNTFVWPGGEVGSPGAVCVPDPQFPMSDPGVFLYLRQESATSRQIDATVSRLLGMHEVETMLPLLAWLSLAPLRSRYEQFPPLFVTGRAGSGKTTIIHETLSVFTGTTFSTNLTSTTPYALALTMGATNSWPVWFDEYRPGARKSTQEIMDQMLRDAYNKASSRRGGLGSDKSAITTIHTDNPLIVSGEDFADEQSHRDRLIRLHVSRDGKGVLPVWTDADYSFAHTYLSWLASGVREIRDSQIAKPPVIDPSKYLRLGITARQAYNYACLDAGYGLLQQFLRDYHLYDTLPEADWSALVGASQEEAGIDVVLEVLQSLYEDTGSSSAIWVREADDMLMISASGVLTALERNRGGATLPFRSSRALLAYLVQDMGATTERTYCPTAPGRRIRYACLPNPWNQE